MSKTVLHIDASARHSQSQSRAMSAQIAQALNADKTIRRELTEGLGHIDETWAGATFTPPADRTEAQRQALALSDKLVDEVEAADVVVIGTPVYNFLIPSTLKAWIDHVARVGRTFRYTETGPVGLLSGKRVIVAVASGGTKLGTEMDFVSPYLKFVFRFVGLDEVEIVQVSADDAENAATVQALGLNDTTKAAAA